MMGSVKNCATSTKRDIQVKVSEKPNIHRTNVECATMMERTIVPKMILFESFQSTQEYLHNTINNGKKELQCISKAYNHSTCCFCI